MTKLAGRPVPPTRVCVFCLNESIKCMKFGPLRELLKSVQRPTTFSKIIQINQSLKSEKWVIAKKVSPVRMPRLVISLNKIPTSGKILLLCVSQINRLNVYKRSNFTCFITNENFSSLTTISNASFNFWRLQANKLMSTTSQERTPCYLLRSPEGIPKTLVFWLRGYTKTRRYSKPALPKILCHSHI